MNPEDLDPELFSHSATAGILFREEPVEEGEDEDEDEGDGNGDDDEADEGDGYSE
jgi:hypothetical protein